MRHAAMDCLNGAELYLVCLFKGFGMEKKDVIN